MILLTDQFDEELKLIKKAMQTADCDMSVVRAWLKLYEKVKKQTAATKDSYIQARANLEEIQKYAAKLEQVVVEEAWQSSRCKEEVAAITGKLRQMDGSYEHEFLVSRENQEYHLTYHSVIELGQKECDKIIFQSEVENLSALNQEILGRETPDFYHLGFYETDRSAEDLSDLPYSEKMRKIGSLYEADFLRPIRKQLITAITYADQTAGSQPRFGGILKRHQADLLAGFYNEQGENKTPEERADAILAPLR